MMISEDQITKLQALYKERFGKDISRAESLKRGTKLLRLVQLTYKPVTKDELDQLEERHKKINNENEY
jgi:urease accessory protein UreF